MNYKEYILSDEWKKLKAGIVKRRGSKCQKCGKKGFVQLHHLTYARLFDELPQDLMLLCRTCHEIEHDIIKTKRQRKKDRKAARKPVTSEDKILKAKKKIVYLNKKIKKLQDRQRKGVYSYDTLCVNRTHLVNQIAHLQKTILN